MKLRKNAGDEKNNSNAPTLGEIEDVMRENAIKQTLGRYRKAQIIFDADFIRTMYPITLENYRRMLSSSNFSVNPFDTARASDVVQYICEFHNMNITGQSKSEAKRLECDPNYHVALSSDASRALFFIEHVVTREGQGIDKRNPLIVFPLVLYNYLLGVLEKLDSLNVYLGSRRSTLCSLYQYMLLQLRSVMSLLSINIKDGVCLWRNLHETECIATILYRNKEEVTDEFIYFQKFAFIDDFDADKPDVIEITSLYTEFKSRHREMKATQGEFREKGWLRIADGFSAENGFNFKRGLQPMAGMEHRYQAYRDASKIVHPSGITFQLDERTTFVFVYEQILLTTTNLLEQIRALSMGDLPDIFDRETATLMKIIQSYFNRYRAGLRI